ncbi:MFS transporter [Streptomyces sp. MA5143a]|uniref:MFS transporter n=1 Tax=Streptomyces sp. MA5143a TaxID=2083010 RepID=UPI0015E6D180|nr:MFS transporter [Streptomyces sp. MA5143a]
MSQPLRRNRDFVLLWSAALSSTLGAQVASVAYPLLALQLTGSAVQAGLIGSTAMAAGIALRLPAGALVDRWDRRRTMLVCDLVRAVLVAGTVTGSLLGFLDWRMLLGVAVVSGVCGVFFEPAETALLRRVVPAEHLPQALAHNEARQYGATIVGPPLGGLLFNLGRTVPLAGELLAHLLSFAAVLAVKSPKSPAATATTPTARTAPSAPGRPRSLLRDIAEGLRWTWRQRFLRVLLVTAAGFGLVFSALTFTAIVAARRSGATPADIGLMMAISGAGGLLGALAAPRLQRRSPTSVVLAMFWVAAAAIPAMALRPTAWTIGPLLAAAFFLAPAANAILYTYQMTITPDHLQGRVLSSLALIGGAAAPVGPLASGLVLDHWGVRAALLSIASVMGLVALGATWSRTVRHLPPLDRARAVG